MFYTYLIYSKIKFAYIIKKVAKIKFFQQGKFKNQAFFTDQWRRNPLCHMVSFRIGPHRVKDNHRKVRKCGGYAHPNA